MICILKDTKYAQIQHRMIHLDAANYINIGGEDFTVHKLIGDGETIFKLKSKDCIIPMFGGYVTTDQLAKEVYAHLHKINRITAGDDYASVEIKIRYVLDNNICYDPSKGENHMFMDGSVDTVSISQDYCTYSFGDIVDVWFETLSDLAVYLIHHRDGQKHPTKQKKTQLNCPYCGTVMEPIDSECSVLMAERVGFDSIMSGDAFDAVVEYHCTNEDCSKTVFVPK